jgi:predicted ester cyclase
VSVKENKATFRRVIEVFNKGNLSLVDELVTPDYAFHGPGGMESRGQEGFKQIVSSMCDALSDLHATIENMVAEGDMMAVRLKFTGTHRGNLMGIAPTGKRLTINDYVFIIFKGGKEAEAWGCLDILSIYQQLGVVPPTGQS